MHDQRLGGGMKFCCLVDRQCKSLRHGKPVVIFGWRIALGIELSCWGSLEALAVVAEQVFQPFE
jgi:hypothetical protein